MLIVEEILKATKGSLIQGDRSLKTTGLSTDSRRLARGECFLAIEGPRFNGHDFIDEALKKGASALIVSRKVSIASKIPVILVKDTTHGLGQIAAVYRQKFSIPVIAVTGSAGKTTTKEMIAAILSTRWNVLKNVKTENNQFGVPLTLLRLNSSHQAAVVELGTNQKGDIAWLASVCQPTIAVFTNIGESHLEKLKNPLGVFHEKFSLVKKMDPQGTVIFNRDDPYLQKIFSMKISQKKISYSIHEKADFQVEQIAQDIDQKIQFTVKKTLFSLNTLAAHNVSNALAAVSCGNLLKIPWPRMKTALTQFSFCDGRQQIERIGEILLIDDTYNANPVSLRSAIQTLDSLKIRGKKIMVCADMLELGDQAEDLHRLMGQMIAQSSVDTVLTFGGLTRHMSQTIREYNHKEVLQSESIEELNRHLKNLCRPDDVVLVKGSRAMQMERVVEFLRKLFSN